MPGGVGAAPRGQPGQDHPGDQRPRPPPVLPREIGVPAAPGGVRIGRRAFAAEAQIADGNAAEIMQALLIGEGIKLLDIAERMMRLPLYPGAQPRL